MYIVLHGNFAKMFGSEQAVDAACPFDTYKSADIWADMNIDNEDYMVLKVGKVS